jgi:hypothetical protein
VSTQTEWHLTALTGQAAVDPFAQTAYSTGTVLDLTISEDELFDQLKVLTRREARLYDKVGLSCELKDHGQNCRTCSMATLDTHEPRSRLCRLGKDQFLVADRCQTLAQERSASYREIGELASEYSEMGHLGDDLAELLTSAGL